VISGVTLGQENLTADREIVVTRIFDAPS
jgi:hypothetical protein